MATHLGLADFLADLRTELSRAQEQAEGGSLKLGVDRIDVELDMAYTLGEDAGVGVRAQAKFWVFGSAEASATGSLTSERANTQRLRLTLTPRVESAEVAEDGEIILRTRGLNLASSMAPDEEEPD